MRYLKFNAMKNTVYLFLSIIFLYSCNQKINKGQSPIQVNSIVYDTYGAAMDAQSIVPINDVSMSFLTMKKTCLRR